MIEQAELSSVIAPERGLINTPTKPQPGPLSRIDEEDIEDLHRQRTSNNIYMGYLNKIANDANHRNIFISGVNAILHTVATATNFLAKDNSKFSLLNNLVDGSALIFTKWVAPMISYGHVAFSSFVSKKPILGLIKLVPPVFLPLVGNANIDMVYGSSTGFNQPYDLVENRIKEKMKNSNEYKAYAQEMNTTSSGNTKLIWEEFKVLCKDFIQGKTNFWKEGIFLTNCIMILLGSIPMMLFARKDRNSQLAKTLGLLRNAGGILGDIGLVFGGEKINPYKFTIGILCSIGAVADVIKRWVNEDVAKVLIHLGAALNVSAYALWNAYNSKNEKPLDLFRNSVSVKQVA